MDSAVAGASLQGSPQNHQHAGAQGLTHRLIVNIIINLFDYLKRIPIPLLVKEPNKRNLCHCMGQLGQEIFIIALYNEYWKL
jgi:hypothetical protein